MSDARSAPGGVLARRVKSFESFLAERPVPAGARVLNVGCGWDVRESAVNVDLAALPGVSAAAALDIGLPFRDATFDLVLAKDVIEHVDSLPGAMAEAHRVLRPGGLLVVSTVHFTSRDLYVDPTHRRGFSIRTLDFYVPGERDVDRTYYAPFTFSAVEAAHLQFHARLGNGRFLLWDWVLEPIVNASPAIQDLYEMTGLSRAFPAGNILVALRK